MGKVGKSLKFLIFREEFLYITCRESMVYHPIGLFLRQPFSLWLQGSLKKQPCRVVNHTFPIGYVWKCFPTH